MRQQRNYLTVAAVLLTLASLGISLPRTLARRNQLKALDDKLIGLQNSIVSAQQRTREVQAEIVSTQNEIRSLLKRP